MAKGLCDDVAKLRRLAAVAGIDFPQDIDPKIVKMTEHRAEMSATPHIEERLISE